ncbi:dihydrolipoamide acetyltransferase [Actinobacillus equuli]|nr:dihydrolipoamide acetyltransferase [Actinobacillus equuli]
MKSGDKVSTGSLIMKFEVQGAAPAAAPAPVAQAAAPAAQSAQPAQGGNVSGLSQDAVVAAGAYAHATPVIRRLAREFGVNLDKVKGSGRKGRMLKKIFKHTLKLQLKRLKQVLLQRQRVTVLQTVQV